MRVKGIASTMARLESELAQKSKKLLQNLVDATPVDTGAAAHGWKLEGNKILNEIDYISELNRGSSTQAPAHFVESTVLLDPDIKAAGIIVEYTE